MNEQMKLDSERKAFEDLKRNWQEIWTSGRSQASIDILNKLWENNEITVEQIKKWELMVVSKWKNKNNAYQSRFPDFDFIKEVLKEAKKEKKENRGDQNHHNYMLDYCRNMRINEIYNLKNELHEIHMGRTTESKWMSNFNFFHSSFLTHWEPLIIEMDNLKTIHGTGVFSDPDNRRHIEDVKQAILKGANFERFWHKDLRKVINSADLVAQMTHGWCNLEKKKVTNVDCTLCEKEPKHIECNYFKQGKQK